MADSTKANIYHSIKPNFGYSLNLSVANLIVKKHEDKTGTKYKVLRSDPNFGEATWNNEDCQIKWEESEKTPGERLPFDGIPFFVLGTRHLGCHFSETEKMNIYLDWKKDNDGSECEAKKEKCPAMIILKEVIKFPHYKIEANSAYEKKKWSKMVRDDLCKGEAEIQRRIYVELPKLDDHVHTITWKQKSDPGETADLSHCLVCNAKISASTRAKVAVFAEGARTSHRQLEVSAVLGDVVQEKLMPTSLHSTTICSKCFNLLDEIDSLEEQLANKKQYMVDKYSRTYKEVTGKHDSQDELMEADEDRDDGKQRSAKDRKRGRPPGSTRGRPRGRPRTKSAQKSPEKSIVKVEVDQDKLDEYSVSYISAVSSPPPSSLKTIKKEDIMSDSDASVDVMGNVNEEDEDGNNDVGESQAEEKGKKSVEFTGNIVEVIEEIVEDGEKQKMKVSEEIVKEGKKQKRKFQCLECKKRFLKKSSLESHAKQHSDPSPFICPVCEKSFLTRQRLKAHVKTHEEREKLHQCDECSERFYTSFKLKIHMKHHADPKSYICDVCGKVLKTPGTLERHAVTHSDERPYQCEICGSTFRQRSNLLTHIKATHYREKNYHCHLCEKSFVRKRLLVYHMNSMHTGERPYTCSQCGATFVYPHHYKRHLKRHTGHKPHKCPICEREFTSRDNRNSHMFTHSNKRPYECSLCGAGHMRKPHCVQHLAVHNVCGNPEDYMIFNSPAAILNSAIEQGEKSPKHEFIGETERAVETVQMIEGVEVHEGAEGIPQVYEMRGNKLVKVITGNRPGYIIEDDDSTHYVIHTTDSERDESVEHVFTEGEVVEIQTEEY